SPLPGSVLAGSSVTFTWTPKAGATSYQVRAGDHSFGTEYGSATTSATSVTFNNLPTNGSTVWLGVSGYNGNIEGGCGMTTYIASGGGPTCTYGINPVSTNIPVTGGTGSVSVTTNNGCAWSASSQANWLSVTSGASGSGSGQVGYSALPNTSD